MTNADIAGGHLTESPGSVRTGPASRATAAVGGATPRRASETQRSTSRALRAELDLLLKLRRRAVPDSGCNQARPRPELTAALTRAEAAGWHVLTTFDRPGTSPRQAFGPVLVGPGGIVILGEHPARLRTDAAILASMLTPQWRLAVRTVAVVDEASDAVSDDVAGLAQIAVAGLDAHLAAVPQRFTPELALAAARDVVLALGAPADVSLLRAAPTEQTNAFPTEQWRPAPTEQVGWEPLRTLAAHANTPRRSPRVPHEAAPVPAAPQQIGRSVRKRDVRPASGMWLGLYVAVAAVVLANLSTIAGWL